VRVRRGHLAACAVATSNLVRDSDGRGGRRRGVGYLLLEARGGGWPTDPRQPVGLCGDPEARPQRPHSYRTRVGRHAMRRRKQAPIRSAMASADLPG
jgi:hypothetical protein